MGGHSYSGVNSGSNSKGCGKTNSHGSGKGLVRGGFARHGSRGGRSSTRGGFASYSRRGVFLGMLNNMDGYRPQMPDQDWSEQLQQGLIFPDLSTMARYQSRDVHSLPSRASGYNLQDESDSEHELEEPVNDEHEVEEEREGEFEDDNVSIPSQTASHAPAVRETTKLRAWIRINTVDVLEPSFQCSEAITECFRRDVEEEYLTWGKVPLARKDRYFEEFRKKFTWDSGEEKAIRGGWNKKATKKFADFTSMVRKAPEKPTCILQRVYNIWMARWAGDAKFQERCAKMKVNRGRASIHNGGSRSFFNTADHLKVELKVDHIPAHTLFAHNHSKVKDGVVTWTSSKSMRVEEAYQREIKKQKQENAENGTPIDEDAAYLKAAGGVTKSGVYGVDQRLYYGSCSSSSSKSVCSTGRSLVSEVERLSEGLRVEKAKSAKIEKVLAQWALFFQGMPNMPNMPTMLIDEVPQNDDGGDELLA